MEELTKIEEHQKLKEEIWRITNEKLKQVMAHREEILTAFVAKFGIEPDEIVQVEWRKSVSEMLYFYVKKSDCIFCERCKEIIGKEKNVEN